jgi:cytochrome c oxidase subunit III
MSNFSSTLDTSTFPSGANADVALSFELRLRRARLGLLVALVGIVMVFISFTSAYVVRQGLPTLDPSTNTLVRDWFSVRLPGLLFLNTIVLVVSSGSMELARRQAVRAVRNEAENGVPWLAVTILLGLSFLVGQWTVWQKLAASGLYLSTNPSSSFVYLLTATHAVHLLGGVVALLFACGAALQRRQVESSAVIVDAAAWYWHFMAVLWVYIFCLLKFAR